MSTSNLALPREQIAEFCRRHHIMKLSLFGSVLRGDFRPIATSMSSSSSSQAIRRAGLLSAWKRSCPISSAVTKSIWSSRIP